ncbi:nickel pincer cofactor biosynthesis protein LarC [Rubrobacter tropicus]|uniref:Pyridinium-3,5-bisthiocarboxylic acid mononucleotide nickel insertion protein n=1 Tax=Rubrobacter tropicus TaxID=2653851 RepID=A0A6G8QEG7_9ACTN|nr:nickel pincer cofactor biosynthesis protein LarC [Rubrobacter tropicus]QIN84896.1 nickel pincer cofactor biosynthesis protein LarC [Rubrobacter tropicus]
MTHVHFQPVGGAAGDMTLASLIAAGAPPEEITASLGRLNVPFELSTENAEVNGVGALRVSVHSPKEHAHRDFATIRTLIEGADLPERAASRSVEAFRRLAVAEGAVHGVDPEKVTFHEVGAVDSVVDVVGSCLALELLDASSVTCGPLPMGTGVVRAAHGALPVPGPATLEVLKGSKIRWTEEPRETTTPTGAALMSAFTNGLFTDAPPPMTLVSIGYGAGRARLRNAPNLLRAVVGELEGTAEDLELLEANVDDAPGELLGPATEKLLAAGALDAWLEPITMKRGRGAYKVCALVKSVDREPMSRLLMRETGTLGVRHRGVGRTVAERRHATVDLPYGRCRIKIGSLDGQDFVASPEFADASRLSSETGLPLPQVYADAKAAYAASYQLAAISRQQERP